MSENLEICKSRHGICGLDRVTAGFAAPGISGKRLIDIAGSVLALTLLAPVFVITALLVFATSKGPVLFRQDRVGKNGQIFAMLKFRSMYTGAEARIATLARQSDRAGITFKMKRDPRVTPVGRIIRRYSIDELPQLINVLRGEMSLVGPRPALPAEVAQYPAHALERLSVLPGITGPWQIAGRADIAFDQMVRMDIAYARGAMVATDLRILLRTFGAVLSARGAY